MNLAKFQQAQTNLGECEERADLNEQALAKLKAQGRRGGSLAPKVIYKLNTFLIDLGFLNISSAIPLSLFHYHFFLFQ